MPQCTFCLNYSNQSQRETKALRGLSNCGEVTKIPDLQSVFARNDSNLAESSHKENEALCRKNTLPTAIIRFGLKKHVNEKENKHQVQLNSEHKPLYREKSQQARLQRSVTSKEATQKKRQNEAG